MKYVMIVGDGMADYPVDELGGKTPLEVANHPYMDKILSGGICGTFQTIPPGMPMPYPPTFLSSNGTDDAKIYHTGRGPVEAVAVGADLSNEDIALRCNIITEKDGVLLDYSAGHISTDEASVLIDRLKENLGADDRINFYAGVSYRHVLVLRGRTFSDALVCVAPHDVMGRRISDILIKPASKAGVETANLLNRIMLDSKKVLSNHPINLTRAEKEKNIGNMIWLWSPGKKPRIPTLKEQYGVKSAIISAVNIVKGFGALMGMEVVEVPGATGYLDTDYEAKADYALANLRNHDMVVVHVEAPDEAAHIGDPALKIKAIEDLDKRLIGRLMDRLQGDYIIAVLADHVTPIRVRTHTDDPVPFAIYSANAPRGLGNPIHFSEKTAVKCPLRIDKAKDFIELFLRPT